MKVLWLADLTVAMMVVLKVAQLDGSLVVEMEFSLVELLVALTA
jgi:hypothetical protein